MNIQNKISPTVDIFRFYCMGIIFIVLGAGVINYILSFDLICLQSTTRLSSCFASLIRKFIYPVYFPVQF